MLVKRSIAVALLLLLPLWLGCDSPEGPEEAAAEPPAAQTTVETKEETPSPAPVTAVPAAEPVTVTVPPSPEPTVSPTPMPTPEPTATPVPTATPTPTPTPEPTATPEPQAAFGDEFQLLTPGKQTAVSVNNRSLDVGTEVEVRLEDGTVVGSGKLTKGKTDIKIIVPEGSPVRTTLLLYTKGQDWPLHTRYVAVLDKSYEPVLGNFEREEKMVALTFDCAYGEQNTDWLLDTLQSYGIHVTFFMTGRWAGNHGPWIERMLKEGHEIGNHTMNHIRLSASAPQTIVKEITKMSQILWQNHGYITHLMVDGTPG